jgi:hypothetical protein
MTRYDETNELPITSSFSFEDLRRPLDSMRLPRSLNIRADILKVGEQSKVPIRCLIEGCFNELGGGEFKHLQNRQRLSLALITSQSFIAWVFFERTFLKN